MTYRLKSIEVEALRIPSPVTLDGSALAEGTWLVSLDGELASLTDEDFRRKFEPVPLNSQQEVACVEPAVPAKRKYAKRKKISNPVAEVIHRDAEDPRLTIADRLEKILRAGPASLDTIFTALSAEVGTVTRESTYQVLWANRVKRGWLFDRDRGLWRFVSGKAVSA